MQDFKASDLQSDSASQLCVHTGLQGTAGGYGMGASGQQLGDGQTGGGGGGFGAHFAAPMSGVPSSHFRPCPRRAAAL